MAFSRSMTRWALSRATDGSTDAEPNWFRLHV
jgi:hypothetical protein